MAIVVGLVLVIFLAICVLLCFLVLIQSDKGGGISSALGGGFAGASNMFGTQDTANILTRATTVLAGVFMAICLLLSLFLAKPGKDNEKSMLAERAKKQGSFSPSSILGNNQVLPMTQQGGAPQGQMPVAPAEQQQPAGGQFPPIK